MRINGRDRGAVLPIVALLLPVLILMTAFAVDLGRQRSSRRTMQARADIIALDLVRLADGRPEADVITGDETHQSVEDALFDSATRNDIALSQIVSVDWGTMVADVTGRVFNVFSTSSLPFPNAVKVTTKETTDYFFRPGSGDVERSAVATASPLIDLTVGALAAGFQPNMPDTSALYAQVEALNKRLARALRATVPDPGTPGFDLAGYRGLAAADVDLYRVAANAGFASPNDLLASEITAGQFFDATATALDQQAAEGDPNAAGAAAELRRFPVQMGVDSGATMQLGDTLHFAQGGDDAAAAGAVNVLDLLSGSADVINGSDFLAYQLTPTVPGITSVNVSQKTIEPATWAQGPVGTIANNKQIVFQVDLVVDPLPGMTQPVHIPLVIEAATAVGTVDRLTCATPSADSEAEIGVDTNAVKVTLGTAADLAAATAAGAGAGLTINQGVLIEAGGLTVSTLLNLGMSLAAALSLNLSATTTGTGTATLGGGSDQLTFLPNVTPVPYQRAPGGFGATSLGAQLQSSLVVSLNGVSLGQPVSQAFGDRLNYVFSDLATIIDPLLASVGVSVGGADVLAERLQCTGPMLVG